MKDKQRFGEYLALRNSYHEAVSQTGFGKLYPVSKSKAFIVSNFNEKHLSKYVKKPYLSN